MVKHQDVIELNSQKKNKISDQQLKVALERVINEWRKKRDRVFQEHGLKPEDYYQRGMFFELPSECLMAACYLDAYRCVESWISD